MFQFTYPAKIEKDEAGFFLVTFPDIHFAQPTAKLWLKLWRKREIAWRKP